VTRYARAVTGDVPAEDLGLTNAHDHLMFASPVLAGSELNDVPAARTELQRFRAAGGRTVVQWTPAGLGRRLADVALLSRRTDVTVIAATGRHRAVHYPAEAADETTDELTVRFVRDIEVADLPAGLIKVGTGFHHLDDFEKASLDAAGVAAMLTSVPVAVHLELGTAGDLVVDRLRATGLPTNRIVLGHVGRHPDRGYHRELAETGAFLCFDGPSRANHRSDWRTLESIGELASAGRLQQLLIGGDTTTGVARSLEDGPGMPGLITGTLARIGRELGPETVEAITVGNPARAFALSEPIQNSSRSIPRSRIGAEWVSAPTDR
jgi:phosphotriesterase-related protein